VVKEHEGEWATMFGQEIWSDVWGPPQVPSLGGRKYFISFTDDYSWWTMIFLLQTKDIFEAYKTFEAWVETHLEAGIACLHSDRGGEYMSKELIMHLNKKGTACKLTVHDTPEENGVSECLNHTLIEKVWAMLWAAGLPHNLWGEAVLHVAYLKNWMSTKALNGRTPYEAVNGRLPDLCGLPE